MFVFLFFCGRFGPHSTPGGGGSAPFCCLTTANKHYKEEEEEVEEEEEKTWRLPVGQNDDKLRKFFIV